MALTPGSRLGPYEITNAIGAGGMGEVYKARDPRLDRIVAIKVLPAGVAGDSDLRERFKREAHAVAALNHPHICTLYDIGCEGGVDFLVMEYLEGETLAARLARAGGAAAPPLHIEEVLRYSIEIADALNAAHRQHILHRDLKPGNVMLTKAGAKLLDFGLAKLKAGVAQDFSAAGPGQAPLPTMSAPLTGQGAILGTLQYMAPEQVEGKDADARTDIFAFGEIVYEMATGKRAFEGKSHASLIAAILEHEPPPIAASQPLTPPALDRVVKKCLAKDPESRWQSARDLSDELKWIADAGSQAGVAVGGQTARKGFLNNARLAWSLAAISVVALVAALALGARYWSRAADSASPLWVSLTAPKRDFGTSPAPAVSPDGRTIAFAVPDKSGQAVLWIRPLDSPTARALAGTEGAGEPFWSPDGRSLGFFAGGKLKRVDVAGASAPQVLADAPNQRGGTWSRDGVIVFGPAPGLPLHRVSAAGGAAVPLRLDKADEQAPQHPSFLPDGRHFLFTNFYGPEGARGVWAASLDSTAVVRVGEMRSRVTYSSGHLLFGRGRELYAQPFDPVRLELSGEPIRFAENLGMSFGGVVTYAFSTSGSDVLAYGTGFSTDTTQPQWLDRRGTSLGTVGEPGMYASLVLSPDERQLAVERHDPATTTTDVWTIDVHTVVASRLTADPDGTVICPLWAADGESILFRVTVAGTLRVTSLDGKKIDDIPLGGAGTGSSFPTAWSSDGRFVVFSRSDPKTLSDLWLVPLAGDRKPRPYLQTPFSETTGRVSPDSRWLAYVSDESGRYEVYVQSFPEPGSKRRVSTNGGRQPQWNKRGTELYYLTLDQKLMAVTVSRAGSSLELSPPRALFDAPRVPTDNARSPYAITADGERFLFNAVTTDLIERGITVGLHWPAALKK